MGLKNARGSGAPFPNPHPNHPLCQATSAAAIFFEVVAKAWIVATSFLRFCRAGSDGVAFMVGALGSKCAACVNCAAGGYTLGFGRRLLVVGCLWVGQWH